MNFSHPVLSFYPSGLALWSATSAEGDSLSPFTLRQERTEMPNLVVAKALAGGHRTLPDRNSFISSDRRLTLPKVGFDVGLGPLTRMIKK